MPHFRCRPQIAGPPCAAASAVSTYGDKCESHASAGPDVAARLTRLDVQMSDAPQHVTESDVCTEEEIIEILQEVDGGE